MRVYNEVYINNAYIKEVEDALRILAALHPEWGIDFSSGEGNWENAEEVEE